MTITKRVAMTTLVIAASLGVALAQAPDDQDHAAHHPAGSTPIAQAPAPGGTMQPGTLGPGGRGPGMMGQGMMGQGMMGQGGMMSGGFANSSAYLDTLKGELAITPKQEKAWNDYADVVKGTAEQMRALHESMFASMGTQSWEQRRDAMNQMFAARQQAYANVHDAAVGLVATLDDAQKAKAERSLPGLAAYRPGMMQGR